MADKIPNPRRSWADKEHARIRCYQFVEGRHTIAAICADLTDRGVDLTKVLLNYSAVWEEDPTPEEVAHQKAAETRNAQRTERWERETLTRLTLKYGRIDRD